MESRNKENKIERKNRKSEQDKMEKFNCEIVGDLLPLYADSSCSKESEEMVESHLKECPYCKRLFEHMTTSLLFPEPSLKEIKMQKAFKKIWFTFLTGVFVSALIVITVTVTDWIKFQLPYREGVNETNWNEVKKVEEVMLAWKEVGIEKAVDLMKPIDLYFNLSEDLTDEQLNEWMGQYFREEAFTYRDFEVAKEKYAVCLYNSGDSDKQYLPWECPVTEEGEKWETPLTQAGLEMKNALDTNDFLSFWYIFMKEYQNEGVIVTEDIYKKVIERYDDMDKTNYHKMEVNSGVYYYYEEIDENGNGQILYNDFPNVMYEILENLEPMGKEFFICANNQYMPKALCLEFMEDYKKVRSYFDEYTKYYQQLGYYDFAKEWREKIKIAIKQLENQGIVLEDYKIDYKDSIFSPDNPNYYGLRVICKAIFSNGKSVYLYFDVNSGRCKLDDIHAVYSDGITKEEKEELEQFVDFIWEALDYRRIVPKE